MPPVRASLKERRNVQLKHVRTAIPPEEVNKLDNGYDNSRSGASTKVPAVRVPYVKGLGLGPSGPLELSFEVLGPALNPVNSLTTKGLLSLYKFFPLLYLALYSGKGLPPSLVTSYGAVFTHVVKITYANDARPAGDISIILDAKRGMHVLTLAVPRRAAAQGVARVRSTKGIKVKTVLTEHQLVAARDYLALALPYRLEVSQSKDENLPDNTRVLVTAPAGEGASVDIMCTILCYLTYVAQEAAEEVVGVIRSQRKIPSYWRDGICRNGDGLGLVEKVAWMHD